MKRVYADDKHEVWDTKAGIKIREVGDDGYLWFDAGAINFGKLLEDARETILKLEANREEE